MQSVPITTKFVSLNPVHGKVYLIQHYERNEKEHIGNTWRHVFLSKGAWRRTILFFLLIKH
jgi:hypothetical protein